MAQIPFDTSPSPSSSPSSSSFSLLKQTCHDACHERHACTEGFRQMLDAENVSQMMACWRDNIQDITTEKFADIANNVLPELYEANKEEMNKAGVYLNECPENAKSFVIIFITDSDYVIHVFGEASAYILGEAQVIAHDNCFVYNNKCDNAIITALDFSTVIASYGTVNARMRSTAHVRKKAICRCYNSVKVYDRGATIYDNGHYLLEEI